MELHLDDEGAATLRRILEFYLSELRMEIADTDRYDFRQQLHRDEDLIGKLLAQLPAAGPPAK